MLILGQITMTANYGLSGLVLYSQFILNELACYTCRPATPGSVHCNSVTQFVPVSKICVPSMIAGTLAVIG